LLHYNESLGEYKGGRRSLAVAHEFVPFQGSSHLKRRDFIAVGDTLGAEHLAHAAEANGLRSLMVENDYILDGTTQIGFPFGSKQHAAGADVFGKTSNRYTFRTRTRDR
jgi:hypothetical protein